MSDAPASSGADPRIELVDGERLLVVRFAAEQAFVSWALVNGGRTRGRAVVWRYVDDHELGLDADPEEVLRSALRAARAVDAVGLLTSRALATYSDCRRSLGGIDVRCIATVGLTNALRAGDAPLDDGTRASGSAGTINLLCHVARPMREEAMLEALALAAEARTAAILEAGVSSRRSGAAATGTGTDCIVIAAPLGDHARHEDAIRFAGKHTSAGHLIGAVVLDAIRDGVARWNRECA